MHHADTLEAPRQIFLCTARISGNPSCNYRSAVQAFRYHHPPHLAPIANWRPFRMINLLYSRRTKTQEKICRASVLSTNSTANFPSPTVTCTGSNCTTSWCVSYWVRLRMCLIVRFQDTTTADTGAANDELGYRILYNDASTAGPAPINTSFYHQDEAVMETLLSSWQDLCFSACCLLTGPHGGVNPGGEYAAQMLSVLEDIQLPADVLLNLSAAVLDYGPWIRHMVSIDDAAEAIYMEAQAGKDGVRKTRNSLKAVQPVRYVPISESSRRTLTHTALRP